MKENFNIYPEFNEAADELDLLVSAGLFSEESRLLVEDRDDYEDVDYFVSILTEWHEDKNQVNKNKSYQYTLIIFNLYVEAVKENPEKALELISSFKLGDKNNTAMEFMTAYAEYVRIFNDTKSLGTELNEDRENISKKLRFTKSVSVAYSNGLEYISKTLSLLICLEKIVKKEQYNFYKINNITLHDKIELFNSESKYDDLLEMIDRNLRNAEAHGTINFVLKTNSYKIKFKEKGGIKEKNVPFQILYEKLISVGNYVQSFEFAGQLLTIGLKDREKFIQIHDTLFEK